LEDSREKGEKPDWGRRRVRGLELGIKLVKEENGM